MGQDELGRMYTFTKENVALASEAFDCMMSMLNNAQDHIPDQFFVRPGLSSMPALFS